jgi:DNA-binding transcriptional regulator YiaG
LIESEEGKMARRTIQSNPFGELRKLSGMTQEKFSQYFGIPKRTVEDWDRGASNCADYLLDLMRYKLEHEGIIENED